MNENNIIRGRVLSAMARNALTYECMVDFASFTPSRSIAQTILYEIYFKPDGVSFEDSGLLQLTHHEPFMGPWMLWDHRFAISKIKIYRDRMEHFKAYILPMVINARDTHKHEAEFTQKQYN